jgi:hypothetical protein
MMMFQGQFRRYSGLEPLLSFLATVNLEIVVSTESRTIPLVRSSCVVLTSLWQDNIHTG